MRNEVKRQMKRDCCKFMRASIFASFFHRLTAVAAPLVAAWLIGDMTNYLLALDVNSITSEMLPFLCAVFFQVVIAALFNLLLNLRLTKDGFAYDGFLMEKFIRLPLRTIQTTDSGAVIERLEEDSSAFCWNQMTLYAYPGAILLCFLVFCYSMAVSDTHFVFVLTVIIIAAIPVIRTTHIGKAQTALKKQVSEYNDARKQMEQELYDSRDFAKCYLLEDFFIRRLNNLFCGFIKKTGTVQCRMDAKTEALDYLCDYGVQLGSILVGSILISINELTLGALLSGYLMIPTIQQCFQYVKEFVTELHDENKYLERLSFFYEADGESEEPIEVLETIDADDISFTYPGSDNPVFQGIHFHMSKAQNIRLAGQNGSGKTTLLSILAGLYKPETGKVCNGLKVCQLRRNVALQEQNGTIFSGTIWDNLFLPDSKRDQAAALLREMGMDKSLEYIIASEGDNLSPGERKKIQLARALLKDAPFLALDEPLNHLDDQGKKALISQMQRRGKGMLIISHQDVSIPNVTMESYYF